MTETTINRRAHIASTLATASVILAIACGVGELIGGIGHRLQWWGVGAGIATMQWSAIAAAVALLLAVVALALGAVEHMRRTTITATLGLLLAAAIAGPPMWMARQALRLPAIHDISTDTDDPPRFAAVLPLRQGAPNGLDYSADVAARQKAAYPDIAPAMLALPPARALELAERSARAMGWDIVAVSPPDLRIEATATTLLFGFKDDVVVRITPAPQGSRVDVRSVSRVGRSDIGANAQRIRAFLGKLDELKRAG
ncbi:MAG TPA: DUF1499 domain-containing protein [Albitalea sp.]|nr:DUF1499 domain-containing protein [Albitalea sp.]